MGSKNVFTKEQLSANQFFVLYGTNNYLINKHKQQIIDYYLISEFSDFDFCKFSEETLTPELLSLQLYSLPMMSSKRVIVIDPVDSINQEIINVLELFITKKITSTIIIFIAKKIDKRKKFYKNLLKLPCTIYREFKDFSEKDTIFWCQEYFTNKNIKITDEALRLFSLKMSTDLNILTRELEKLIEYSDNNIIEESSVERVCGISKKYNIFTLQDSLVAGNLSLSINIIMRLLKDKDNFSDPIGINLFLSKQFIAAYEIKYTSENKNISVNNAAIERGYNNPWRDRNIISLASRYSLLHLKNCLRYFLEADIKLKSSYQNKELVLIILIKKIVTKQEIFSAIDHFNR